MFRNDRLLVAILLAFCLLIGVAPARAADYPEAIAQFATDSFADTEAAITAVAISGNPLAPRVIGALQQGQLLFDASSHRVVFKDGAKLIDAATGQPVSEPVATFAPVRLNNRLRRSVEAALGGLTLLSPDRRTRLDAAQSVFKSREAATLPTLEGAIAKEQDAEVKRALMEARAAVVLYKADAVESDKIDAVAMIRQRGDQEAVGLLSGLPSDTPASVTRAAQAAVTTIQNDLAAWAGVQNAWYGLSLGSVLLLAAIGLAITFGVMGVINMAHGEMVMLGAYTTFVVQEIIRTRYPGLFDLSLVIAVPLAFLVAGAIGVVIERSIIRFLYGRPLETLLATWGLSLVLQQAVRTAFGPTNREVGNPTWMSGAFELGQITITYNRLWILVFTLAVFAILLAMLRYTALGLEMRAVTQNRRMAASMGIAHSRVAALTFGIG